MNYLHASTSYIITLTAKSPGKGDIWCEQIAGVFRTEALITLVYKSIQTENILEIFPVIYFPLKGINPDRLMRNQDFLQIRHCLMKNALLYKTWGPNKKF
jgi:hypothetical protein